MPEFLQSLQKDYTIYIYPVAVIIIALVAGYITEKIIVKTIIRKGKTSGWRFGQIFASTSIFANIAKFAIYFIGLLLALQALGFSTTPFLTALGVGGIAVALALQDTLSNLFSGLYIIASQQVKAGDFVKIDTQDQGYIEDITWRNTTIRTLGKNLVIIPNSKMASAIITNYSQPGEDTSVGVDVHISYDNDLAKVEVVTLQVAEEIMKHTPGAVKGFKPSVGYAEFADTYLKMSVSMRGEKFSDQYLIKHEFIKKLHEHFLKEGINITAPVKPLIIKKEN